MDSHTTSLSRESLSSGSRQIAPCAHYVVSGKEGRLTEAKLQRYLDGSHIEKAKYYIAGPPGMVSSFESMLSRLQVAKDSILTDSFTGYDQKNRACGRGV